MQHENGPAEAATFPGPWFNQKDSEMNKLMNSTDGRFESMAERLKVIDKTVDAAYDLSALLDLVAFAAEKVTDCSEADKVKVHCAVRRTVVLANATLDDIMCVLETEEQRLCNACAKAEGSLVVPIVGSVS